MLGGQAMHHPLANFSWSMCAKNYEKLFRVDEVINTNTMYGFLGHPIVKVSLNVWSLIRPTIECFCFATVQ